MKQAESGTYSRQTGGKFSNGASTVSYAYGFSNNRRDQKSYLTNGNTITFGSLTMDVIFLNDYDKIKSTMIGGKILNALSNSTNRYYIKDKNYLFYDAATYNPIERTIFMAQGMHVYGIGKSGIIKLNSDTILMHELGHAYEHEINGNYKDEIYIIQKYENPYSGKERINHYGF